MSLVQSLLGAIVRLDGDSLVLHVGEKPYVVTSSSAMNAFRGPLAWGQVELSSRSLTVDAINAMLDQLLTAEQREVLNDLGAVEGELPADDELPPFTLIAARGGEDIWLEIRPVRARRVVAPEPERAAAEPEPQPIAAAPQLTLVPPVQPSPLDEPLPQPIAAETPMAAAAGGASFEVVPDVEQEQPGEAEVMEMLASAGLLDQDLSTIDISSEEEQELLLFEREEVGDAGGVEAAQAFEEPIAPPEEPALEEVRVVEAAAAPVEEVAPAIEAPAAAEVPIAAEEANAAAPVEEVVPAIEAPVAEEVPIAAEVSLAAEVPVAEETKVVEEVPSVAAEASAPEEEQVAAAANEEPEAEVAPSEPELVSEVPAAPGPSAALESQPLYEPEILPAAAAAPELEPEMARPAAVVLPLSRGLREQPPVAAPAPVSAPDLDRLLRVAAARGASGLYLVAQSQPVVRVDGEMQPLDDEERLTAADVEAFMLALAPEPTREAVRTGETSEWFRDVPDIGRVRCLSFRDHRGPGVMIRMLPARAISVEQLGLSKEIQAVCGQPDGLVLIAGPRASGKSTLVAAFVELVNRTRADHVIMIERQISFVHESRRSFVSQREVRGDADAIAAAVRSAQREDPDVLVIEELRSADVIAAAVEAAESGRLVFAGIRAPAAVAALERLVDQCPAERRPQILTSLASSLRAVVGQVLLRKRGGGRIAARELLLNTPAAAALIGDGKLFQLPAALESGRKLGSTALNDALAALVRDGIVDPGEAWRKAYDREGLLTLLKREGIDTSFVERLA